jgi:hypothetical protein
MRNSRVSDLTSTLSDAANVRRWVFYLVFALMAGSGGGYTLWSFVPPQAELRALERRVDALESESNLLAYKVWILGQRVDKLESLCEKLKQADCK